MSIDYSELMAKQSDKELIEILTKLRDEYQPEALLAAKKEAERRKLDAALYADADGENPPRKDPPFEWYHKALTILAPGILIYLLWQGISYLGDTPMMTALTIPIMVLIMYAVLYKLKENGHEELARDYKQWLGYSTMVNFCVLLLLCVILYFYSLKE